jgi:hypothetical protein
MTVNQFRKTALTLPDVEESAPMGHPDFRARGKIFAALGYPDKAHGALMLTPEQQKPLLESAPEVFRPAAGAWGRAGSTVVRLKEADFEMVGEVITLAWQNAIGNMTVRKRVTRAKRPV